jgi:hypothetical protein
MATRKERARVLVMRLKTGPKLFYFSGERITPERITQDINVWLQTWILPEVADLVPEIRQLEKEQKK